MVAVKDIRLYINVKSGGTLTLRSRPSTDSDALGYLRRGDQVKLLAFNDDWACIRDESGRQGFAAVRYLQEEYIQPDATATPAPERPDDDDDDQPAWMRSLKRVDTDVTFCNRKAQAATDAKLHRSASGSSSVLGTIPSGMEFTVLGYNSEWAYVTRKGIYGFVKIKYIKLVS